jgi:hypothetical protein
MREGESIRESSFARSSITLQPEPIRRSGQFRAIDPPKKVTIFQNPDATAILALALVEKVFTLVVDARKIRNDISQQFIIRSY